MIIGLTAATIALSFLAYQYSARIWAPRLFSRLSQWLHHSRPEPTPSIKLDTTPPSDDTTPRASPTVRPQTPPSPPCFPALNSAQRASGKAPPALAPPRLPTTSMPPPPRPVPLPNRGPPTSRSPNFNSSLSLPPTTTQIPAKPSKKVLLAPGHSPLDWARLTTSRDSADLRGVPAGTPLLRIRPSELRKHNKRGDAWMTLGGRVYNVTPYMGFHPGGERELMKGAGRDGEKLFMEVHPWVNYENMLGACMVGLAVEEESHGSGALEEID